MPALLVRLLEEDNRQRFRATAGILWQGRAGEPLQIAHHWGFGQQNLTELSQQWQGNEHLLQQALASDQATRATGASSGQTGTQSLEIVACPILNEAQTRLVVQFFFAERTGLEQFLQAGGLADRLVSYRQAASSPIDEATQTDTASRSVSGNSAALALRLEELIGSVGVRQRLLALLNECCLQTGTRRCSLFRQRGGKIELLGCSGMQQVEPRAPVVTELTALVRSAFSDSRNLPDQTFAYPENPAATELAPTIQLISLDETSSAIAGSSQRRLLVLEWEQPEADARRLLPTDERAVWKMALRSVSPPGLTAQSSAGIRWQRWGLGLLIAAGLLAIPIPLTISAPGYYVPRERSAIYAPETGVIAAEDLHISPDRQVQQAELLLTITSRELELKIGQVEGTLATTAEQIRSLRSTRPERDAPPGSRLTTSQDISLQLAELTARQTGLQQELALLQERKASLQVRSPLSGAVLSWEPETQLASRPVSRGQLLLMVGNLAGEWDVLAEVRDRDLGHFKQGLTESEELQLRPHTPHLPNGSARLQKLSPVLEEIRPGEWAAPVLLQVESTGSSPLPGARVTARLSCGYYPAGYVWFRNLLIPIRQFFTW